MLPSKPLTTKHISLLDGCAPHTPRYSNAAVLGQQPTSSIRAVDGSTQLSTRAALPLLLVAFLHLGSAFGQTSNPAPTTVMPSGASVEPSIEEARTFGKWRIICAADGPCRLSQSVVAAASKKPVLIARAYQSAKDPVLVLSFPLGVFLAPGVSLAVDRSKPDRLPYETCDVSGCHLGVKLTSAMLTKMRKAKTLTVAVHDGAQNPVAIMLDLDGFSNGLNGLPK